MRIIEVINEGLSLDGVGSIEVTWDFDDEYYREWLSDEGLENNKDSLMSYIRDYVEFEVETFDNDTFHHMSCETCDYDELEECVGERMCDRIVSDIMKDGSSKMETSELYNSYEFDVNDPEQLNAIAMKMFNHGEYYRGCRGFILTNGVVVYTPAEHNMASMIDGIKDKFDFIRKGNIRVLDKSIDLSKEPTQEQRAVLREVISAYSDDELYVDIFSENGNTSAKYVHPEYRYVMGEIDRFFSEGISLMGSDGINESAGKDDDFKLYGYCDSLTLYKGGDVLARYDYKDSTAYPFIIYEGKILIGDCGETHGELYGKSVHKKWTDEFDQDSRYAMGRIWVKAKRNEFNYAVVAFWGRGVSDDTDYKPYVYEIARKLKVNPGKIVISVSSVDEPSTGYVPLSQWNGLVRVETDNERENRQLHMMGAREKHDNTGDFRNTRNKKIGQKLTNSKGEEMPMAQYHSMIYQEDKKQDSKNNIVITESQYRRLFRPCK